MVLLTGFGAALCDATTFWDMTALKSAPQVTVTRETTEQVGAVSVTVRELTYDIPVDALTFEIFAYYAYPTNRGSARLPGMVLVHGGGGTADKNWATSWAAKGYGSLAMDLPGKGSGRDASRSEGPDMTNPSIFLVSPSPKNSYLYSAVIAVCRAVSLMANQPEIDPVRIGMLGRSWGGVITQIANGIDDRLAAACTVFGAGYIPEDSAWVNEGLTNLDWSGWKAWRDHYDPSGYFSTEHAQTLYIGATNDAAFPLRSFAKTTQNTGCPKAVCYALNKNHADDDTTNKTTDRWFECTLQAGAPLPAISVTAANGLLAAKATGSQPIASLALATANSADLPGAVWTSTDVAKSADGTWSVSQPGASVPYMLIARDATGAGVVGHIHLPDKPVLPKQCIDWIRYDSALGWTATPLLEGSYVSLCPNTNTSAVQVYAACASGGIDSIQNVAGVGWVASPLIRGTSYADICESYATPGSLYGARADGTGIDYLSWNGSQWTRALLVPNRYVSIAAMTDPARSGCMGALAAGGVDWINWTGGWVATRLVNDTYRDICGDLLGLGCMYGVNPSGGVDWIHWYGSWTVTALISGDYVSVATGTPASIGGCFAARADGDVYWIHSVSGKWRADALVTGTAYTSICGSSAAAGTVYGLAHYPTDIAALKLETNNESVKCKGVVTAAFQDHFYIETLDRTSGIRVERIGYLPTVGSTAIVRGRMAMLGSGERYIAAVSVTQSD